MSALPPKADVGTAQSNVCYGPKADKRPLTSDSFEYALPIILHADLPSIYSRRQHPELVKLSEFGPAVVGIFSVCVGVVDDQTKPSATAHRG